MSEEFITAAEGRDPEHTNVVKLGEAIAKQIGATVEMTETRPSGICTMTKGDLRITVTGARVGGKPRARFRASVAPALARAHPSYWSMEFPKITVDPRRDIAAIVADVKRKIVMKSQKPLEEFKKEVEENNNRKLAVSNRAEEIKKMFTSAHVTVSDDGLEIKMRARKPDAYFYANILHDGAVSFQRIGNIPADRAMDVIKAILGE